MLFFPYQVDLDLPRYPFLTILICIACIIIYADQHRSHYSDLKSAEVFCGQKHERAFSISLKNIAGNNNTSACENVLLNIHYSNQSDKKILDIAKNAKAFSSLNKEQSERRIIKILEEKYALFNKHIQPSLTKKLMYYPDTYDISTMISSAFAHADIFHLLGNLIFFFAFAAAIEMALGYLIFPVTIILLAIGTNLTYALTISPDNALPTLGLSGVVMGMIGLFTYLMPLAKIRCFFWFLVIFKRFYIPAWILAVWYVGWDIYNLTSSDESSNVNFIAHISGAFIGYAFGFLILRKEKLKIRSMVTG